MKFFKKLFSFFGWVKESVDEGDNERATEKVEKEIIETIGEVKEGRREI